MQKRSSNAQWESYYSQQETLKQELERQLAQARAECQAATPRPPADYNMEEKMTEQYKTSIADAEDIRNEVLHILHVQCTATRWNVVNV